jgi:miniconductance mechanosensitive channel
MSKSLKYLPSKRFLSNLGSFRAYAEQYLFEHQWLNDGASPMAVIYDTSAEGVTVLFTAYSQPDDRFVRTKAFLNLESDIVEHLITTSRYFGLKLHQSESEAGVDEKSATFRVLKRRDF